MQRPARGLAAVDLRFTGQRRSVHPRFRQRKSQRSLKTQLGSPGAPPLRRMAVFRAAGKALCKAVVGRFSHSLLEVPEPGGVRAPLCTPGGSLFPTVSLNQQRGERRHWKAGCSPALCALPDTGRPAGGRSPQEGSGPVRAQVSEGNPPRGRPGQQRSCMAAGSGQQRGGGMTEDHQLRGVSLAPTQQSRCSPCGHTASSSTLFMTHGNLPAHA